MGTGVRRKEHADRAYTSAQVPAAETVSGGLLPIGGNAQSYILRNGLVPVQKSLFHILFSNIPWELSKIITI
jgi:hypothetical protein